MSVFDELDRRMPGWDVTHTADYASQPQSWQQVCRCGHTDHYHPDWAGGRAQTFSGSALEGCFGPMSGRGAKAKDLRLVGDVVTRRASCPCKAFVAVCEFDRPRIVIFRSKLGARHPLLVALGSFRTQVSNRRGVTDVEAELTSRFRWIESARVCSVCGTGGEGVWPVYVDEDRNSEMRCEEHTP